MSKDNTMGSRLKELRGFLGLKQSELGDIIGVRYSAISHIELGNRNLTDKNIKLLCEKLNISENWLRNGTGDMFLSINSTNTNVKISSIHNRVKLLRKILNLTQASFSKKIGIKQSWLSSIEKGIGAITDRNINTICDTFCVNENWLRNGEGEIFSQKLREETIYKFVNKILKDEKESFKARLINILTQLTENEWETLENIAKKIVNEHLYYNKNQKSIDISDIDIEEETALYKQFLQLKKQENSKSIK